MLVLQWLKKYLVSFSWKDFIYLTIVVVLFSLYLKSCGSQHVSVVTKPDYKLVIQKVDKKGTVYTQITGTTYTEDQMKVIVDSVARVTKQKSKNITNVISTITYVDTGTHTNNTIYVDSFAHTITDSTSTSEYSIAYTGNYKTDSGEFRLHIVPDTATYITSVIPYSHREDSIVVNVYHTNKLFTPKSGYSYGKKIPKEHVIASVGPFIGLGYNGKIVPITGVALTLNLFSIKKR